RPEVELAWGSRSMSNTGWPSSASAAPRLMAVVVLPTPPFWLTTARTVVRVVANILGSERTTAAISGAIQRNCSLRGRWMTTGSVKARDRPTPPFGGPPCPGAAPPPPRTLPANLDVRSDYYNPACNENIDNGF